MFNYVYVGSLGARCEESMKRVEGIKYKMSTAVYMQMPDSFMERLLYAPAPVRH